ncbi:MAG: sulfite exporter TauE/SafE family protein [Oleiphilaceae bacterium]|nr:sulfite exporter TauE/SafE family protein [Oleiphilaceae bacterium]
MLIDNPGAITAALMLGLLGGSHCIAMCGGLASVLGMQGNTSQPTRFPILLAYNLGRISSYTLAGIILGLIGFGLSRSLLPLDLLRTAAGIMLVLMGCYIGQWFNGLVRIEKLGQTLWRQIAPLGQRWLPIRSIPSALVVGMVWGWLPCGLVYSALVYAATQAHPLGSALTMLAFGVGTLPAMLLTGYFAQQLQQWIRHTRVKQCSGIALIMFGLWTMPFIHTHFMGLVH